jgi:laminin, gamma 1
MQLPDETIICLECPIGYFGSRCEICSDGYFGDPTGASTGKVQLCQACDCNGNIDPNAVGNCNRTTGECMKCIHNTAGPHCDQCLPGHFGDPYASPHGSCEACSCYPRGTIQSPDGISMCDAVSGNCDCKVNVVGKNCNECQKGFWNIASGEGCQSCKCDPVGSFDSSCDTYTGQCMCKPGITGLRCDKCEAYQYGFSSEGCKPCDCDVSGSKSSQCDEFGQCPCNDNVEGRTCNRCKENKFNRHQGCLDCPPCYNLVQDAANGHRQKLSSFDKILMEISENPTVIEDHEFESKLKALNEKVNIVLEDAKAGAGGGTGRSLTQKTDDLRDQLSDVDESLKDVVVTHGESKINLDQANDNLENAQKTIEQASQELTVSKTKCVWRTSLTPHVHHLLFYL